MTDGGGAVPDSRERSAGVDGDKFAPIGNDLILSLCRRLVFSVAFKFISVWYGIGTVLCFFKQFIFTYPSN